MILLLAGFRPGINPAWSAWDGARQHHAQGRKGTLLMLHISEAHDDGEGGKTVTPTSAQDSKEDELV